MIISELYNLQSGGDSSMLKSLLGPWFKEKDMLSQWQRILAMLDVFRNRFSEQNVSIVRAPGRVNLIGEHTDYNGYPVLPMALERDILVVFAATHSNQVIARNLESQFEEKSFVASPSIPPYRTGDWGNYIKAAVAGLMPIVKTQKSMAKGFHAVYSGNIPSAAGLSSSSALVVASALSFIHSNRMEINPKNLAEILAHAERYVGTEGGGMDQAISLLAQRNHALEIDFFPLETKPVPLPPGYEFVICNSLIRASKTQHTRLAFNRRPIECRLATALIVNSLEKQLHCNILWQRLCDVDQTKVSLDSKMYAELIRQALTPAVMNTEQLACKLQIDIEQIREKYLKLKSGDYFIPPEEGFRVHDRYLHVIQEANRVRRAVQALRDGAMQKFGVLMNQSHTSCASLYHISTPELDQLTRIARKNGALGARLTGAGFGGCTVNLISSDRVAEFMENVFTDYYQNYLSKAHPKIAWQSFKRDDIVFSSTAMPGAGRIIL